MDCKDTPKLIHPYLDGELEPAPSGELAMHLQSCADCTRLAADQRALSRAIRAAAPRFKAPEALRIRLMGALAAEEAAEGRPPARSVRLGVWRPMALAASLALAVVTSSGVTAYFTLPGQQDRLVQDVVSGHVRSLMADHLTDVPSSDQHTVKPWFNGKIDLSPPVQDLAAEGYPLVGGRIDYLDERPVAALVYRHRQHPINLFVLPAHGTKESGSENFAEHGYNVLHWTHGDMSLWAVSDLNLAELRDFQRLYERRSAAPAS